MRHSQPASFQYLHNIRHVYPLHPNQLGSWLRFHNLSDPFQAADVQGLALASGLVLRDDGAAVGGVGRVDPDLVQDDDCVVLPHHLVASLEEPIEASLAPWRRLFTEVAQVRRCVRCVVRLLGSLACLSENMPNWDPKTMQHLGTRLSHLLIDMPETFFGLPQSLPLPLL
jgi:hypothetical protein